MSQTSLDKRQAEQLASIEEIANEVRMLSSIEHKAREGAPLSISEISYLFRFETPAHERQESRVQWDYDDVDTETYNRWKRELNLREELRPQSAQVLQETHGADADWLLLPYDDLRELLPGLIESKTPDELTALLPYIAEKDLLELFDSYVGKLTPDGRKYVAERLTYQLTNFESGKVFVRRFAKELYKLGVLSDWVIVDAFSFGDSIMEDIAALRAAGIPRLNITNKFSQGSVEAHFDQLVEAGFSPETLARGCSREFVEKNRDKLYAYEPTIVETYSEKGDTQDQIFERIIDIQERGGSITAQLNELIRHRPFHNQEMFDRLVTEAHVSAETILEALIVLDPDTSYVLWYAKWLVKNGIDHQKVLNIFAPGTIVDHRDRFREAGITIDVSHYLGDLNPEWVLWSWERLHDEKLGVTIDEVVARIDGQIESKNTDEIVQRGLVYGANAVQLLAKVADGTIIAESTYERVISAGISREQVWPKLHKSVQRSIALGVVATGAEEVNAESSALFASLEDGDFSENLERLCATEGGANTVFPHLPKSEVDEHYRLLVESGVAVERVIPVLQAETVAEDLGWFLEKGAKPEYLFEVTRGQHLHSEEIEALVEAGFSVEQLVKEISSAQAQNSFDFLLERVTDKKAFVDLCLQDATRWFLRDKYIALLDNGADVNQVGLEIEASVFIDNLNEFMIRGADSFTIMARFNQEYPGRPQEWYLSEIRRRTGV